MRSLLPAVAALALTLSMPLTAIAQPAPTGVEILAQYPDGTFLENLEVLADGRIVFTSYFAKTIEVVVPGSAARTFASLSAHPVSIRAVEGGYLVAAHGQAFNSGTGFVETQQFLLLDRAGRETASFKAPDARFLNGMVRHVGNKLLVADSIAGTIWQVDPKARTVEPWLKDWTLAPLPAAAAEAPAAADGTAPAAAPFKPGANGLKRNFDALVISNSSRGTLSTVTVGKTGSPEGTVRVLAEVGPIDDFAIGADGAIVFATHGATLKRLAKDGGITTLMASGCDGCTAVSFAKGRNTGERALVVLTTGGMLEGGKTGARVLRLPYRVPARK